MDILLEFLAGIAFIFLLVVVIIAMIKAPMLIGHGSIEMSIFVFFGLIHSAMNLADEFLWFTQDFYKIWKALKDLSLLLGAIVLLVGFFRFFQFSARLFGSEPAKDEDDDDDDELEEAVEEVTEIIDETDKGFTEDVIIEEVVEEVVEETLEDVLEDTADEPVDDVIEDIDEVIAETIENITELDFTEETTTEEATEPEIDFLEELEAEAAEEEEINSDDTEFS